MIPGNLAVFFSGFGSNLQVFLDRAQDFNKLLPICSHSEAFGLKRVEECGLDAHVLKSPIDWESLHQQLIREEIHSVFLAGFMKIIPESFVERWEGRIYNLHPSLLPAHKGLKSIRRAYEAGDDLGVSIHRVIAELDAGPILMQERALKSEDISGVSFEEAEKTVHTLEHQMVEAWIEAWLKGAYG